MESFRRASALHVAKSTRVGLEGGGGVTHPPTTWRRALARRLLNPRWALTNCSSRDAQRTLSWPALCHGSWPPRHQSQACCNGPSQLRAVQPLKARRRARTVSRYEASRQRRASATPRSGSLSLSLSAIRAIGAAMTLPSQHQGTFAATTSSSTHRADRRRYWQNSSPGRGQRLKARRHIRSCVVRADANLALLRYLLAERQLRTRNFAICNMLSLYAFSSPEATFCVERPQHFGSVASRIGGQCVLALHVAARPPTDARALRCQPSSQHAAASKPRALSLTSRTGPEAHHCFASYFHPDPECASQLRACAPRSRSLLPQLANLTVAGRLRLRQDADLRPGSSVIVLTMPPTSAGTCCSV